MGSKNRSTLKQQFTDFINRDAPFNGNTLIQKSEHLAVETDFFDSVLMKEEDTAIINSPPSSINIDFSAIDSYTIDTSGSIETVFTLNVNNLSNGTFARIDIDKKSNDVFTITSCPISGLGNLNQQDETSLHFVVFNVKGRLFAIYDKSINKSDAINDNNTNQISTSKAVRDLKIDLENSRSAKDQGAFTMLTAPATGDYIIDTTNAFYRVTDQGEVQLKGYISTTRVVNTPIVTLFILPPPAKLGRDTIFPIGVFGDGIESAEPCTYLDSSGEAKGIGKPGTANYYIDGVRLIP